MPRKSKLCDELIDKLAEARRLGASIALACDYVGINKDTYFTWMRRGATAIEMMEKYDYDDPPPDEAMFVRFHDAMIKAKGEGAFMQLEYIEKAAKAETWQAAKWKLMCAYPNDYEMNRIAAVQADPGHEESTEEEYTDDEVSEFIDALREAGQLPDELFSRPDPSGESSASAD